MLDSYYASKLENECIDEANDLFEEFKKIMSVEHAIGVSRDITEYLWYKAFPIVKKASTIIHQTIPSEYRFIVAWRIMKPISTIFHSLAYTFDKNRTGPIYEPCTRRRLHDLQTRIKEICGEVDSVVAYIPKEYQVYIQQSY